MPTVIYFSGAGVWLKVEEQPGQVADAFTAAAGVPFRLTSHGDRGEVYINPAMVAFWSDAESGPEPAASVDTQPSVDVRPATSQRQAVTDLWGNPVRKKRRG